MKYNEILKALREDKDMTQIEIAKLFNLTQRQVSNYEVGRNEPAYDILIKYAKFFNVSIDYILGISKNPKESWIKGKTKSTKNIANVTNNGSGNITFGDINQS